MDGPGRCCPNRSEIGQFGFQAFYLEPQRRPAGKNERDHPRRRISLGKLDRKQVKHRVLAGRAHVPAFAGQHALEAQSRTPAAVFLIASLRAFPIEAIDRDHDALFLRPPQHVGDLGHRVLQVGRSDLEILLVEDNEF